MHRFKKLLLNRPFLVVLVIVLIESIILIALAVNKQQEKQVENYPDQYPYTCNLNNSEPGCAVIEDAGKVKVAQRDEVKSLVRQYGRKGVIIRALEFEDVNDKDFLKRLLGDNYVELGCIIYVEYPSGQYVYLEDEKLDVISRLDGSQFEQWLQSASKEDREKFYSNLH